MGHSFMETFQDNEDIYMMNFMGYHFWLHLRKDIYMMKFTEYFWFFRLPNKPTPGKSGMLTIMTMNDCGYRQIHNLLVLLCTIIHST